MTSARIQSFRHRFSRRHPVLTQFLVFFLVSNGVTLLQLVLMPLLKAWFDHTPLVGVDFRLLQAGGNVDGSPHYVFDYAAGAIGSGGGGGLAYFLAVQLSLLAAQVVNFFLQRRVTFKAGGSIAKAAFWYVLAYLAITLLAGVAQGFYKAPVYDLLMHGWGMGRTGETVADVVTMLINSTISFWVFFPIFRLIFRADGKGKST